MIYISENTLNKIDKFFEWTLDLHWFKRFLLFFILVYLDCLLSTFLISLIFFPLPLAFTIAWIGSLAPAIGAGGIVAWVLCYIPD